MANSATARIEKAQTGADQSRRIFRNFRDATVALLGCDDLPKGVGAAVDAMLDYFNNELGGADEPTDENAYRVMSNVFRLDDADEEEARRPAPRPAGEPGRYKEICAEGFTLVDEDGGVRARLCLVGNDAVLAMGDSKGRPRLKIRACDNEAMITICGERGWAGKDVFSATDEVERVKIGYEPAYDEPRIVIQAGDEKECVALSIDGEDGAGLLYLTRTSDGGYVSIDNSGLSVYDIDHKTLAEYGASEEAKDRSATSPTSPTSPIAADLETPKVDWEPRRQDALSDDDIRDLVRRIIHCDDDDAVKAFILLVDTIARNDEWVDRNNMATRSFDAAYQRTMAYHDVAGRFFDGATAELRLRAS